MKKQGTIVRWDASRGFGFIRSPDTSADVFFHVRDFRGAPEPTERMAVDYEEIHVGGKGPRAMAVRPRADGYSAPMPYAPRHVGAAPTARQHPSPQRPAPQRTGTRGGRAPAQAPGPARGHALAMLLVLVWLGLVGWALWSARLPLWSAGALLGLQLVTVWTYARDKNAARARAWRTSENQLHLLSLLGGWPAAWWAQQNLRHKTSKASFRTVYWLTIGLHCGALVLWLWHGPEKLLF